MNYGFNEPPNRIAGAWGIVAGGAMGLVAGTVAFLVVKAFTLMILDALPNVHGIAGAAIFVVFLCIPAAPFATVARNTAASVGARMMGVAAFSALAIFAIGEFTGTMSIYPSEMHFYIVPIVKPSPAASSLAH